MRQLLYVSNTISNPAKETLENILDVSRRNNAACDVTGMLLLMEGAFLQVLEGPDESVEETYRRICTDARHWDAHTLIDQRAPARAFAQWSMGFQRLAVGGLNPDSAFRISRNAVAGQMTPDAPVAIATLLDTFLHVNATGQFV